jgi:hypothetical protein
MGGQDARKHPHGAPGIAGVEQIRRRPQASETSTIYAKAQPLRGAADFFDCDTKRPEALERRTAVAAG